MREFCQHVCRSWSDDDDVAFAPQRDVGDVGLHARRPQVVEHGPMGDGLKRQRRDEALRVFGHGHVDDRARLVQRARQANGFEGGDAAGDAERHAPPLQNADQGHATLRS